MSIHVRNSLLAIALLTLAACSTTRTAVTTIDIPTIDPGLPRPIQTNTVEFDVIDNRGQPNFCVDQRNYSNLIGNVADLKRYLEQLQQNVIYYRNANKK